MTYSDALALAARIVETVSGHPIVTQRDRSCVDIVQAMLLEEAVNLARERRERGRE